MSDTTLDANSGYFRFLTAAQIDLVLQKFGPVDGEEEENVLAEIELILMRYTAHRAQEASTPTPPDHQQNLAAIATAAQQLKSCLAKEPLRDSLLHKFGELPSEAHAAEFECALDELISNACPSSEILRHRAAQIKGGSGSFG